MNNKIATTLSLFALLIISTNVVFAQKNIETQDLIWTRYSLKLKIKDPYQIKQELEERTYWFPWRQHQFLSRTLLERKLAQGWSAALGITYSMQSLPNDPTIRITENITELRPQVEISYNQILSDKISLNHRYWSEFRFFEQSDNSFDYSNNRTRYKLELGYTPSSKITLKIYDEILLNIGGNIVHNVFNQNRYGASIQYMPVENFGVELSYFNSFQERPSGVDFYNRNIIRFTIHQTINLKKPKI